MRYPETVTISRPTAAHDLEEVGSSPALIAPVAEPAAPTLVTSGQTAGMTVYLPPQTEPPLVGDRLTVRGRAYTIHVTPQEWVGPDGRRRGTVINLEAKP